MTHQLGVPLEQVAAHDQAIDGASQVVANHCRGPVVTVANDQGWPVVCDLVWEKLTYERKSGKMGLLSEANWVSTS